MNVAYKIAPPNIIEDFPDFESWSNGNSSAPDGWEMAGTAGSVSRETTNIKFGTYGMKIISGASANYRAEYSVVSFEKYAGRTVKFGCWVKCSTASKARIGVNDGVTTTYSSYHTGGGDFEFLTVTVQVDAANTILKLLCEVASATITAYFDSAYAAIGELLFTDLRSSNYYVDGDDVQLRIAFDVAEYDIPRRDGTVIEQVRINSKKITIKTKIYDDSFSAARSVYDSLVYALTNGKKQFYHGDDRFMNVFLTNISSLKYRVDGKYYEFQSDLTAPEPYERSLSKLRNRNSVVASSLSFDVTYNGSVDSFPKILIVPVGITMSSCLLENLTTGERFTYSQDVAVGVTLEVDCDERTAFVDGVDGLSYWSGDHMRLVKGTNHFKFTGGSNILLVDYYEKFL